MIKNLIKACALIAGLFVASEVSAQQYNSVATAYLTTTLSQFVVFNSTMQQGGTFDFSVLAHNGGGRAGQSDTANVKIEFFNSSNTLITSANTTYSSNLPNPTALGGNPQIDPAVPWTTLTISKTLSAADAANVSYAKVSIYGIDGSYWAGDYGPWYRAPTLSLNSGGNLLYNPEFGPYNNVNAQGWNISPSLGACQGAWGGSNACIVDASGTPGRNTTGLVANANGGGPSATGGTTSGTAGGYNSTMSTTNPTGGAPAGPTVVSTAAGTPIVVAGQPVAGTPVVTTQTVVRTVNGVDANGNPTVTTYNDTVTTTVTPYTTTTTTTPTTVTTYSDGSTQTTNGTATTSTAGSSTTATSTAQGGVQRVSTTAPVAATPVVTRGTTVTTEADTFSTTTVTNSSVRGTTVVTSSYVDHSVKDVKNITVTRDTTTVRTTPVNTTYVYTTPVTMTYTAVTPITTTVTTTPTTTVVDANGNVISVTAAGPGVDTVTNTTETVVTTATRNDVAHIVVPSIDRTSSVSTKSATASATGITDVFKASRTNPFIVDVLSTKDGSWVTPGLYRTTTTGRMTGKTFSGGYQNTVDNNSVGFAFNVSNADSAGFINTRSSSESYSGVLYLLSKQDYVWIKTTVGMGRDIVTSTANIPNFGITGTSKASQVNTYGDVTVYAADTLWGFRPLAGATLVRSVVGNTWDTNPLLPMAPAAKTTMQVNPYVGLRYEFNDNIAIEARDTQTKDFGNVKSIKATVKEKLTDDISVNASVSYAKGHNYTNTTGLIGLDWKF